VGASIPGVAGKGTTAPKIYVVHHNPNRSRYAYAADPTDAQASARTLVDAGEALGGRQLPTPDGGGRLAPDQVRRREAAAGARRVRRGVGDPGAAPG
jgi:hypothetical protein